MNRNFARITTIDAPVQPDVADTPVRATRGSFATMQPYLPLLAIVLLGIGLRLWMIGISPLDPSYSNADDGDYYRRALRLALTGQYIDDNWLIRPPLHVFFYAFWLRLAIVIGRPALGVPFIQLAQTVLAALTIMLGYGIGRRLFPSGSPEIRQDLAGLLFALFLSTWYSFVEQPSVLFSELIYMFLFLLHVWLLLRFDTSGRRRYLALSGFALGAATLTRSPALYSLAFVVLWLVVRAGIKDQRPKTKDQLSKPFLKKYPWSFVIGHSSFRRPAEAIPPDVGHVPPHLEASVRRRFLRQIQLLHPAAARERAAWPGGRFDLASLHAVRADRLGAAGA